MPLCQKSRLPRINDTSDAPNYLPAFSLPGLNPCSLFGGKASEEPLSPASLQRIRAGGVRWSDKALERFTAALEQARSEGFRGPNALKRAQIILWPKPETSVIDSAISDDDADFVEKCVLDAFDVNDPVYIVGLSYYTTRKKISDITRELQKIAPWLTADQARERVKWCLKIFQGRAFLSARKNLRS